GPRRGGAVGPRAAAGPVPAGAGGGFRGGPLVVRGARACRARRLGARARPSGREGGGAPRGGGVPRACRARAGARRVVGAGALALERRPRVALGGSLRPAREL